MYVSKNNIFLASVHYPYYDLLVRGEDVSAEKAQETTILHKISIQTGGISYVAQGEVPGHILNQFSMDEYNGFFRIATTVGSNWWFTQSQTSNNVYILNDDLERVGQIENIAPGESIYAARFMGSRTYLVTFVQVDPLFTLDLSDPYNPKILGELKIPGYSNYLHPYDENHIIGIGKEVDETVATFTAIQGLKIALFDVSDFENPKEIAKVVIGDRGTDSPALYDHKAFLFDREKELLVIPVSLYEITQEVKDRYVESQGRELLYGEFTFQGAYVYRLSLEEGFEFQGRITHQNEEQMQHPDDYYWYWGLSNTDITRTLYIGDVLYTISDSMIKMNNLGDLREITSISLS
jgi:inhibitor of cysteine peptidase